MAQGWSTSFSEFRGKLVFVCVGRFVIPVEEVRTNKLGPSPTNRHRSQKESREKNETETLAHQFRPITNEADKR